MAYVISDDCVSCGACAAVCPADAISEGDGKYVIDADACLDCGTCEGECRTKQSIRVNNFYTIKGQRIQKGTLVFSFSVFSICFSSSWKRESG